ncbi:unnamed protein product [Leptosia nina]|uniref:Chitin-binding type-2 domain-containing protein n=1 Tax=Leptosia nina TaxID=320188 RepID=A0AAV1JHJ9_9NEOP
MATALLRCILAFLLVISTRADEIELEATSGIVLKMLREMANQTSADTMNLPANATSIRENITDTFSCENRVYGYYADVDNDCQIFHVCLPSQTPSGRNVTYRWSFICPAETVFNQEVLVCTRDRDSIPCEDSPAYYDLNMEIGKIADNKEQVETTNQMESNNQVQTSQNKNEQKETENVPVQNQKRFPSRKKQNMVEKLVEEAVEEMNQKEDLVSDIDGIYEENMTDGTINVDPQPEVLETTIPETVENIEDSRLGSERRLRTGRHGWRGSFSVISSDNSDERYIDSLNDDEKREFLEKIARRILEDYQDHNIPIRESHVNISDDDLNAHTSYVQGILKEERNKQIERRDNQDETKKNQANNRESNENDKFIDLTMRTQKRDKRRNVQHDSKIHNVSIIPVDPVYDGMYDTISKTQVNKSIEGDGLFRNNANKSKKIKHVTEVNNNLGSSQNLQNFFVYDDSSENKGIKSTVINFDTTSNKNEESVREVSNYERKHVVVKTTTPSKKITFNDNKLHFRKESNESDAAFQKINTTEIVELTSAGSTSTIIDYPKTEAATVFSTVKTTSDFDISTEAFATLKENGVLQVIKNNPELVRSKNVLDNHASMVLKASNKTSVPSLMATNTTQDNQILTKSLTSLNTKSSDQQNTTTTTEIVSVHISTDHKNIIKSEIKKHNDIQGARKKNLQQLVISEKTILKDFQTIESLETASKENKSIYYIYEVSAERPPFIPKNVQEQPHYAPVYNYSPEFANYNPHNRFGHDGAAKSKEDEITLNDLKKFIKNIQRRARFKTPNTLLINPYKLQLYNVLKHKNQYNIFDPEPVVPNNENYNPNDYIDMDYFFGRKDDQIMRKGQRHNKHRNKIFPDTHENDHPYVKYSKGRVKDHLRAVRKLLFSKQRFGYIPSIDEKRRNKDKLRHRVYELDEVVDGNKDKDDIAIDYYFGRQNSQEVDLGKNIKYFNNFQYLGSITPIPIERGHKDKSEFKDGKDFENHKEEKKEVVNGLEVTITVLRDFIRMDNEALVNYDWLATAVDIRSAIEKLNDLTLQLKIGEHVHPSDFELLKYIVYLYKSSQFNLNSTLNIELLQSTLSELRKNRKKSMVPKIIKKQKGFRSAIKMWKDFATYLRSLVNNKRETLEQFKSFLAEVDYQLNDLHEAIKHIAMTTTYNSQSHTDFKDVYLKKADRRKLLQVLLHLSLSRLLGLIEDSSKNGLEDNFSNYLRKNRREVQKAKTEFRFVLRLLQELKKIN